MPSDRDSDDEKQDDETQEIGAQEDEFDSDVFDAFDDEDRRRSEIIRRARVEGIEIAYESALAVCRDAKAPAQAKASAQRTLMQIGGLLDKSDRASHRQKPLHEWTPEELAESLDQLKRELDQKNRRPKRAGVFD